MKAQFIVSTILVSFSLVVHAYEGPRPLRDVKVGFSLTTSTVSPLYVYKYTVTNPPSNDGDVWSVEIFLSQDPDVDDMQAVGGLSHCTRYYKPISDQALSERSMTEVGSTGPADWSCSYAQLADYPSGSYGWAAPDEPLLLKPGHTLSGFSLKSNGLPAIREILVEPYIYLERLPDEYNGDVEKTTELQNKVKWLSKTVAPKFPPKIFIKAGFLDYLISLKDQSIDLGWIKDRKLEKRLDTIFARAKKSLSRCQQRNLKQFIGELVRISSDQKEKGLTAESRALLLYNAKYFQAQLPELTKNEEKTCRKVHHDNEGLPLAPRDRTRIR